MMAMGKIVIFDDKGHVEAASMEGLIAEIIQVLCGAGRKKRRKREEV